jgi:hypothetical protein
MTFLDNHINEKELSPSSGAEQRNTSLKSMRDL